MKRLLAIGILIIIASLGANIAHAQDDSDDSTAPTPQQVVAPTTCALCGPPTPLSSSDLSALGASPGTVNPNGTVTPTPANTAGTPSTAGTQNANQGSGLNGDPSAAFGWLLGGIMTIFAWLAGTAGVILNDTILYTVVQMGSLVNPNNLNAIGVAWRILRDLGNIVLIFGFVAVGISTIVGYESYGVSKRLPMLIIVAVFINFSLFASEAVIDVGNLFATEFYTQINGGQPPAVQGIANANPTDPVNGGVTGTIMNSLALQTMYNINAAQAGNSGTTTQTGNAIVTSSSVMLVGILGTILFIILAFTFFALALILIFRFVALVFLMIVAPVGFAGLLIPGLEGLARKWWKQLFEQTLTAPALLLMLYVAVAVITDAKFLSGFGAASGTYTAVANGATGAALTAYAGLLLAFLVAMGLLLACVIIAKNMGAFGASAATKWAGKASFGVTAFVGRRTIGKVSNWASKGIRSSSLGQSDLGRLALIGTDYAAKGSFDVRGSKAIQSAAKDQKIDLGAAQKGGYEAIEKGAIDSRVKHSESLQGNRTAEETKRLNESLKTVKDAEEKKNKQTEVRDKAKTDLETLKEKKEGLVPMSAEYEQAEKDIVKTTKRLDDSELALTDATTKLTAARDADKTVNLELADTFTKKDAQRAYAKDLEKGATLKGMVRDAAGFGGVVGVGHGVPVGLAAGALAGGVAGLGVGLTGMAAYGYSAAYAGKTGAAKRILGDLDESEEKKLEKTLREVLKRRKEGGGSDEKPAAEAED